MKQRASNIELIRILSMFLIIGHHFSVHGGFYFYSREITGNMLFLQLLSIGGKVGVNLFVMISGYFMINAQTLRFSKVMKLWLQLFFYSMVIFLAAWGTGLTKFTPDAFGEALIPVLSKQWWFASSYFFLYLLMPFVNRLLQKLDKKRYLCLLLCCGVFWYLLPMFTWLPERIRDLLWFLFLYGISGFLGRYGSEIRGKSASWLTAGAVTFAAAFGYAVVVLHVYAQNLQRYETVYFDAHHLLMLLISVMVFLGLVRMKIPDSRIINQLASLSFGVYLIHDSNYLRYFLWRDLLKSASYADSAMLVPYALVCVVLVYAVCAALEAARLALLDKNITELSAKAEQRLHSLTGAGK